jgi:hypothetical protein
MNEEVMEVDETNHPSNEQSLTRSSNPGNKVTILQPFSGLGNEPTRIKKLYSC